ncbi:hypothetical protein BpHYR1_047132 [Brachionus plicatilis]|uniref:Uncharacterized protein n=1 Tax=Brachionus plicatilis TaxID=10195 RepID=A0A3M7RP82_BRAPC|nr:hypothetical protein BpHYR1_047132 [Brachionus plicatilis]
MSSCSLSSSSWSSSSWKNLFWSPVRPNLSGIGITSKGLTSFALTNASDPRRRLSMSRFSLWLSYFKTKPFIPSKMDSAWLSSRSLAMLK